jgi:hypothetical protein
LKVHYRHNNNYGDNPLLEAREVGVFAFFVFELFQLPHYEEPEDDQEEGQHHYLEYEVECPEHEVDGVYVFLDNLFREVSHVSNVEPDS